MSNHNSNRIVAQTDHAALVATALTAAGCEIESIQIGGVRPVIWLHENRAAGRIPSATYKREKIRGQVETTVVAFVNGCSVRWRSKETAGQPGIELGRVNRRQEVPA